MSDYEKTKKLEQEAAQALEFSRKAYEGLAPRDFYQQAVLRCLGLIIKLLLRINEKI